MSGNTDLSSEELRPTTESQKQALDSHHKELAMKQKQQKGQEQGQTMSMQSGSKRRKAIHWRGQRSEAKSTYQHSPALSSTHKYLRSLTRTSLIKHNCKLTFFWFAALLCTLRAGRSLSSWLEELRRTSQTHASPNVYNFGSRTTRTQRERERVLYGFVDLPVDEATRLRIK